MRTNILLSAALAFVFALTTVSLAQDANGENANPADAPAKEVEKNQPARELVAKQSRIADRYARLEELLFKLKNFEEGENPRRARLLEQAFEQSKQRFTKKQLDAIVSQLSREQWSRALKGQDSVKIDLLALLELLKSEDRGERIKSEQQRIKEYIKEIERLQRIQKGIRGQNEGGIDAKRLAEAQERVANRTGDLAKEYKENEEGASGSPNENSSDDEKEGKSGKNGEDKEGNEDNVDKQADHWDESEKKSR